ncbi:MAG: fused response regulator/phosphatase [Proteobacteria bacterium]|nr:fused response regulator/phosphatase [Pseudomonadota bacterium]
MPSMQDPAPQKITVLVVDDTPSIRQLLQIFLKKLGYDVLLAENGLQAVEKVSSEPIDLVLMDVMMPLMDGYAATRRIKALSGERWIPVVFLSALDRQENLVAGLDAGGDDYLGKPLNFVVLEAKLRSLNRTLLMQRALIETRQRVEDNAESLQRYHDTQVQEDDLAQEIMMRLMNRDGPAGPGVHQWLAPAANFSGDIVAATRSPQGKLYALLADATGHGLSAAISALPVLMVFSGMVKRDLALSTLVEEINKHLCSTLPTGRFVAVAAICVDSAKRTAEVWNGGMPDLLLLDPDGQVRRRLASVHLALGIADLSDPATTAVERVEWSAGSQFMLYSDGLMDAENAVGAAFGMERIVAALAGTPRQERLERLQQSLAEHVDAKLPHDDISVLLIDCDPLTA